MALSRRKGALRYLVLAIIPQSLSKGFEAMGDRAVAIAGQGKGAGSPYYIVALLLTVAALGLCLFALKRIIERLMGKDQGGAGPTAPEPSLLRAKHDRNEDEPFDPDADLRRYMEKRPSSPETPVTPASRLGGFGKKGL